jgi:hypothetical protein
MMKKAEKIILSVLILVFALALGEGVFSAGTSSLVSSNNLFPTDSIAVQQAPAEKTYVADLNGGQEIPPLAPQLKVQRYFRFPGMLIH